MGFSLGWIKEQFRIQIRRCTAVAISSGVSCSNATRMVLICKYNLPTLLLCALSIHASLHNLHIDTKVNITRQRPTKGISTLGASFRERLSRDKIVPSASGKPLARYFTRCRCPRSVAASKQKGVTSYQLPWFMV